MRMAGFAVAVAAVIVAVQGHAGAQRPPQAAGTVAAAVAAAKSSSSRYCVTCHSDRAQAGGLTLAGLDIEQPGTAAVTWEKAVRKLRTGMMPPAGAPRPDRATLDRLAAHLESVLDKACRIGARSGRRACCIA